MKRLFLVFTVFILALVFAGCRPEVNLTDKQETQYASTEVITDNTEEKTNYVQRIDLSRKEEFLLNAFATGNRNNAVFEILTEDYTAFELKTYKFQDGQWQYTNNFCNGKIKDKLTLFAVEYYHLPDINFAFNSGSLSGTYYADADNPDYSYTSHKNIREWFEVSEDETAFIAYRRLKAGAEGRVANTSDFKNPDAVTNADENEEYYMITIKFSK